VYLFGWRRVVYTNIKEVAAYPVGRVDACEWRCAMPVYSPRAGLNALAQQSWGWAVADLYEGQVHLDLEVGALWQVRGDPRWHVIICCRGVVWITQERDMVDYVLQQGEIFIVMQPGLVLVQALETASVTVVQPSIRTRTYAGDYCSFR
jgi:hypothetical protein